MFRALVCQILLISFLAMMTGCNATNEQTATTGNPPASGTDQWRCSISVSVPLWVKGETYTIDQEKNVIHVLGITETERPIILAEYHDFHLFLLEVYINRNTTIHGTLIRKAWNEPRDQMKFHGFHGRYWKLVAGKKPSQEEFYWTGTYRTDGETIYFDALEKDAVTSTWIMTTKAPRHRVPYGG